MNRMLFVAGLVITLLFLNGARAEVPKPKTIPLDQIWALNMPGTQSVTKLEPEAFGEEAQKLPGKEGLKRIRKSLISEIQNALKDPVPASEKAKPCFAVLGTGREALDRTHAVLVKNEKPKDTFPAGSDVSLVVFSHMYYEYMHLEKVERDGDVVTVRYRFLPHMERDVTDHFAIIPLGKLPQGKIRVEMVRSPATEEYAKLGLKPKDNGEAKRLICQSCSFEIAKKKPD